MRWPRQKHRSLAAGELLLLLALLGATLAPRLYRLGERSYWYDEGFSVCNAAGTRPGRFLESLRTFTHVEWKNPAPTVAAVCDSVRVTENTPPLYFLLLSLWMRAFGTGEAAVRGFSVLAGTLTVLLMLCLGRSLIPRPLAWTAAWLLAVSPLHIYFSREARNYALAGLIAAGMLLLLLRAQREEEARPSGPAKRGTAGWWAAYWACGTLGLYTNYMFGPLMVAHGLALAVRRRPLRGWGTAVVGAFLLFAPWLLYGLAAQAREAITYRETLAAGDPWLRNTFFFGAKLLFYLFLGETGLKLLFLRLGFLTAPILILLALSAAGLARSWRESREADTGLLPALSTAFYLGLLVLLCLATRTWMLVQTRFAVLLLPGLCLAVAAGLLAWPSRGPVAAAALVCLSGALFFTPAWPLAERPYADWRRAAATLANQGQPGDLVVHDGATAAVPFNACYDGPLPQLALPLMNARQESTAREILLRHPRVWLMSGHYQLDPAARGRLLEGFHLHSMRRCHFSLDLALYVRRDPTLQSSRNPIPLLFQSGSPTRHGKMGCRRRSDSASNRIIP
jgi:4-amino-4-deoxy-L-arabinose transferase-like glycosyltransferase